MHSRIAGRLAGLAPAERRVAEALLADPAAVLHGTVASLARAAGVSDPTVIRACRALGFDGFAALRLEVARAEGAARPAPPAEAASPAEAALGAVEAGFTALRRALDPLALSRAARAIALARVVEVWGTGMAAPPAEELAAGLDALRPGVALRREAGGVLAAAATLPQDAVAVLIAGPEEDAVLPRAAAQARAAGAEVVALSPPGLLPGVATHLLACPEPVAEDGAALAWRGGLLGLGAALVAAVAARLPEAAARRVLVAAARREAVAGARRE